MTNLILCGGAGTRLWPLSRQKLPKQFYPLFHGQSLFEFTVRRNQPVAEHFFVASNHLQMSLAEEQLRKCGVNHFGALVEPVGRNTAPAIALACLSVPPGELVLVTPSDHIMTKEDNYQKAISRALELASLGSIVTFGIQPSFAETGFGYIEARGEDVVSFREKPDLKTAEEYVRSGKYLWNSGMFLFRADVYLKELEIHAPEVFHAARTVFSRSQGTKIAPSLSDMQSLPSVSIDIAVMEKTSLGKVVACDPGWSDLGSFDALFDEQEPVQGSNRVLSELEPVVIDSENNLIVSGRRRVALIDVEDLIVIDTEDSLLIVKRGSSQKVKHVVETLKNLDPDRLDQVQAR